MWLSCSVTFSWKRMSHSILLVKDDKTRYNSVWLVHNDFWIIKFAAICNLPVHTIIPWWGTIEVLPIGLETILVSRAYITEKHCSVAVCTFRVVMAFGGMRREIKAIPEPLKILPDKCSI
jgi:hypothetical protein